jgi:hypothetical protein
LKGPGKPPLDDVGRHAKNGPHPKTEETFVASDLAAGCRRVGRSLRGAAVVLAAGVPFAPIGPVFPLDEDGDNDASLPAKRH